MTSGNIRLRGKILTCNNPSCRHKFYRPKSQIDKVTRSFCSSSCSAIVNNLEKGLRGQKECFNPDCCNPAPSYKKFCSRECYLDYLKNNPEFLSNKPIPQKVYAKRVIKHLKDFVKQNGRIPYKREVNYLYRPARKAFGSWNQAIKTAGFKPNQLKFTRKYLADDGHLCDSLAEKVIDDWLFAQKIKHQTNYPYPFGQGFTVDFKVGHYWIEYFGLTGQHQKYDHLKSKKLKLAKKHQLKIIEILPKDLFPKSQLNKILKFLLAN